MAHPDDEDAGPDGSAEPLALFTAEELVAELFGRPFFQGVLVVRKNPPRGGPDPPGPAPFTVTRSRLSDREAVNVLRQTADFIAGRGKGKAGGAGGDAA